MLCPYFSMTGAGGLDIGASVFDIMELYGPEPMMRSDHVLYLPIFIHEIMIAEGELV